MNNEIDFKNAMFIGETLHQNITDISKILKKRFNKLGAQDLVEISGEIAMKIHENTMRLVTKDE